MRTTTTNLLLAALLAIGACSTGTDGTPKEPAITPVDGAAPADAATGYRAKPREGRQGRYSDVLPSFSLDSAGLDFECGKGGSDDYQEIYPPNIIDVAESYYFEDLDGLITRFHTVSFDKYSMALFGSAFEVTDGLEGVSSVLDMGTGTGALSFAALAQGAERAVGTELDPLALRNASFNARQLGVADRFEGRLVPFDDQGAYSVIGDQERFDLILSDPPQGTHGDSERYFPEVEDELDAAGARELFFTADVGFCFLKSVFEGLDAHLSEGGRLLLAIKTRPGRRHVHHLCIEFGFQDRVLLDVRDGQLQEGKRLIGDKELMPDLTLDAVIIEVTRIDP